MNIKTRRIIHHACWFTVLGPFTGVPLTVAITALYFRDSPWELLFDISRVLPQFLVLTWLIGALPALATGVLSACLSDRIYDSRYWRSLACAAIGGALALLYELIPHALSARALFSHEFVWIVFCTGLFAGGVLGFLVPRLAGHGNRLSTVQPETNG